MVYLLEGTGDDAIISYSQIGRPGQMKGLFWVCKKGMELCPLSLLLLLIALLVSLPGGIGPTHTTRHHLIYHWLRNADLFDTSRQLVQNLKTMCLPQAGTSYWLCSFLHIMFIFSPIPKPWKFTVHDTHLLTPLNTHHFQTSESYESAHQKSVSWELLPPPVGSFLSFTICIQQTSFCFIYCSTWSPFPIPWTCCPA